MSLGNPYSLRKCLRMTIKGQADGEGLYDFLETCE